MRVVFVVLISSFIAGPAAHHASAQEADAGSPASRVALVIGNASYPNADPPLTQPIGNARTLGEELVRDGFQVDEGENLTKEAMQRAFGRLYDRIKPGSVALIFFSGYGLQSNRQSYMIPVRARFVSKTVDSTTQLGEVRVSISFDERLKAGMFGRAIVNSGQRCDRVAVPLSALLYGQEGSVVQVVRDERIESRIVTTGLQFEGNVEIRQGIVEGDMVVARAGAFLRDGDRVKPVVVDAVGRK